MNQSRPSLLIIKKNNKKNTIGIFIASLIQIIQHFLVLASSGNILQKQIGEILQAMTVSEIIHCLQKHNYFFFSTKPIYQTDITAEINLYQKKKIQFTNEYLR